MYFFPPHLLDVPRKSVLWKTPYLSEKSEGSLIGHILARKPRTPFVYLLMYLLLVVGRLLPPKPCEDLFDLELSKLSSYGNLVCKDCIVIQNAQILEKILSIGNIKFNHNINGDIWS